jgi:hypothetical protein
VAHRLIGFFFALIAAAALVGCGAPEGSEGKAISGQEYNTLADSTLTEQDKANRAAGQASMNAEANSRGR